MFPETAVLFPGGGAHYPGMGKKLSRDFSVARNLFNITDDILGMKISELCCDDSEDRLDSLDVALPAIFMVSCAYFQVLRSELGFSPSYLAGHSAGEFAALYNAGAIEYSDAVRLLVARSRLIQNKRSASLGMIAVNKITSSQLSTIIRKIDPTSTGLYVSVINSDRQHVVSGRREAFVKLQELIELCDGKSEILPIDSASHSPFLASQVDEFKELLASVKLSAFHTPVISNVTGSAYDSTTNIFQNLADHLTKPVLWKDSMEYLISKGVTNFVDSGPKSLLKNIITHIAPHAKSFSLGDADDWNILTQTRCMFSEIIRSCLQVSSTTPQKGVLDKRILKIVNAKYSQLAILRNQMEKKYASRLLAQQAITATKEILSAKGSDSDYISKLEEMAAAL